MLKNILELNHAKKLNKEEQKSVKGGFKEELISVDTPCGDTGGRVRTHISSFLCAQYGGVYLGNNTCMICH
ncbi:MULTISPECIES: hypothetical protein [Aquimarina]|uniref:Uncharacterized protein n=1 Tax=Aquimarina algiphila TaxID=2047982 RepID=A0A554VH71_9FLAO|nr:MULTISPECIES: hypothetical protein [Aquimarina]TSE06814.1 hypothetical protein FOF46_18020 [Aquimarina algiphila]